MSKTKSTTSVLEPDDKDWIDKVFQNKDFPKATRQYTRDGFLDMDSRDEVLSDDQDGGDSA